MTLITTGLTNGGRTTHYQVEYDDSLSQADGKDRANALIAVCESDFNIMANWFRGVTLTVATPIHAQISPGAYASAGWGPPIRLTPGNGSSLDIVRYLLVSEVTEMFMLAQNKGWFGTGNEGSAGEGLSRFLGSRFLAAIGHGVTEPGFQLAPSWLNSPRQDFVNNINLLDHGIDATTGCASLFIYYLYTQLGFGIEEIIAAAAPELSGVYRNLTRDGSNPFPHFKHLLDVAFPPTNPDGTPHIWNVPGPNPDDPFPLLPHPANRNQLAQRAGDFDGDGISEILVTSPWGVGILKETGSTMNSLMLAPNGTRFGGWLLDTSNNRFGPIADYDGDGHDEILVTSPWGIGILKFTGGTLTPVMMAANGTRFGGWLLDTSNNNLNFAADYDGDRHAEILITSPWGVGILKLVGNTLTSPMLQPNGTRFGGWLYSTADNKFGPAADYDGDGRAEILITSGWGMGILKLSGNTLTAPMMAPNGTRFGGWLMSTADNEFGPAADYDGDGHAELVVTSGWGMGILKLAGATLTAPMMAPNGTHFGGWNLQTGDNDFGPAADYDGDGRAEILATSSGGIGILKLSGSTLTAPMVQPNGTRFGGWLYSTAANRVGSTGKYTAGTQREIFITSGWGIGILRLSGNTLASPMLQPNGTRFGGWLLDTSNNVF